MLYMAFEIPGTNVNMMVVPGEVTEISYTFDKTGRIFNSM